MKKFTQPQVGEFFSTPSGWGEKFSSSRQMEIKRVASFASAESALAAFGDDPPDLVITDFNMPGMNAVEFLEAFRQVPDLEDIPVIVVSSHSEPEKRHRALLAGATDFLMVPF